MPRPPALSPEKLAAAALLQNRGLSFRAIASQLGGASHATYARALSRRTREDFPPNSSAVWGELASARRRSDQPQTSWTLGAIRAARDAQMRGDFKLAVRLAEMIRSDDALYIAREPRLAAQFSIPAEYKAASESTRAEAVLRKARLSIHTPRAVLGGIHSTLVDHGIAIGYIVRETIDQGSRVDFHLKEWPLEHVRWDYSREVLETSTKEGPRVRIEHGDGFWVVFAKHCERPWIQSACLTPASFVWAAHAEGLKDWSAGAKAHGMSKIIGTLPENFSHQLDEAGNLTPEAAAFLAMLRDIADGASPVAVAPFESKVEFVNNGSSAWQVFTELVASREKAAARIYTGTDAILGSVGGAPGVDIATLFGLMSTKLQGDFQTLEDCLYSGVSIPWCAVNVGDSSLAPRLEYLLPDPDEQKKTEDYQKRLTAFFEALEKYKSNGMTVDDSVIKHLANLYKIEPPALAPRAEVAVPLQLAPTDVAKVVRAREARAAQGLPPFGDERDDMTLLQLETYQAPGAAPPAAPVEQNARTPAPAALSALAGDFDETKHPRANDGKFGSGGGGGAPKKKPGSGYRAGQKKRGRGFESPDAQKAIDDHKKRKRESETSKRLPAAVKRHEEAKATRERADRDLSESIAEVNATENHIKTHSERIKEEHSPERIKAKKLEERAARREADKIEKEMDKIHARDDATDDEIADVEARHTDALTRADELEYEIGELNDQKKAARDVVKHASAAEKHSADMHAAIARGDYQSARNAGKKLLQAHDKYSDAAVELGDSEAVTAEIDLDSLIVNHKLATRARKAEGIHAKAVKRYEKESA